MPYTSDASGSVFSVVAAGEREALGLAVQRAFAEVGEMSFSISAGKRHAEGRPFASIAASKAYYRVSLSTSGLSSQIALRESRSRQVGTGRSEISVTPL